MTHCKLLVRTRCDVGQSPNDRFAEVGYIGQLTGRDHVAIDCDRFIDIQATSILDVDGNRWPAGDDPVLYYFGRNKHLRAMADCSNGFCVCHGVSDEVDIA